MSRSFVKDRRDASEIQLEKNELRRRNHQEGL
jgi:hypothetical protein